MHNGRLIRVSKFRNDPEAVVYVVAHYDTAKAIALIREQASAPGDEVEDLGRVTDNLLTVLKLGTANSCARKPGVSDFKRPQTSGRPAH